jgi:hypothetical protein
LLKTRTRGGIWTGKKGTYVFGKNDKSPKIGQNGENFVDPEALLGSGGTKEGRMDGQNV